jgi:hypothetical protein
MPDDRFFPHVSLLPQVVYAGFRPLGMITLNLL